MFVVDSLLWLLGAVGLAYGLDLWIRSLLETGYRTFDMTAYLQGSIAGNLALALALFILARRILLRRRREPLVGAAFLLVGLAITLLPVLLLNIPASARVLTQPEFRVLRIGMLYSSSISRLQIVGAFASIVGLASLLPRPGRRIGLAWERLWQAG